MQSSVIGLAILCLACITWALWSTMKYKALSDELHTLAMERDHALDEVKKLKKIKPSPPPGSRQQEGTGSAPEVAMDEKIALMASLMATDTSLSASDRVSNLVQTAELIIDESGKLDPKATRELLGFLSPAEQRLVTRLAQQVVEQSDRTPAPPLAPAPTTPTAP